MIPDIPENTKPLDWIIAIIIIGVIIWTCLKW
jgi:hypothetical protein